MADWDEIRKQYRPRGAGGTSEFPVDPIEALITDKKEKAFRDKVMRNSGDNAEGLLDKLESSSKKADVIDFPSKKVADDGTDILDTLKKVDVDDSALPNPTKYDDQLMKAVRENKLTGMPNVDARISDTAGRSRMALPMERNQISKAKLDPSGARMASSREMDKIKALASMKNKLENRPSGSRMANSGEKKLLDSLKGSRMGSPKEMSFMKKLGKKLPGAAGLMAMLAMSPDDASASEFIPGLDMADSAGESKLSEDMMMAEIQAKKDYAKSPARQDKDKRALLDKMSQIRKKKYGLVDTPRKSHEDMMEQVREVSQGLDQKFEEMPDQEREKAMTGRYSRRVPNEEHIKILKQLRDANRRK